MVEPARQAPTPIKRCSIHRKPLGSDGRCVDCRQQSSFARAESSNARFIVASVLVVLAAIGGWIAWRHFRTIQQHTYTQQQVWQEARSKPVVLYATTTCPACGSAREYMHNNDIQYVEKDVDKSEDARKELLAINPQITVPTFVVDGIVIVGNEHNKLVRAMQDAAMRRLDKAAESAPR